MQDLKQSIGKPLSTLFAPTEEQKKLEVKKEQSADADGLDALMMGYEK